MTSTSLFNRLPGDRAPDWSVYASIFVRGIFSISVGTEEFIVESRVADKRELEWIVCARLKNGNRHFLSGRHLLADCPTRAAAEDAARRISEISGLRIET